MEDTFTHKVAIYLRGLSIASFSSIIGVSGSAAGLDRKQAQAAQLGDQAQATSSTVLEGVCVCMCVRGTIFLEL